MSTELEINDPSLVNDMDDIYSDAGYEPHDIASHRRKHSVNRSSIIINCLVIVLIGLLGATLVESGIFQHPSNMEALDIPLIPNIPNTLGLPTAQPPIVDSPRGTDESISRVSRLKRYAPAPPKAVVAQSKVERLVSYALAQQGKRYSWGASGPRAFDCSGLVVASFRSIGIALPHYTGALLQRGIRVSRASLRRGDLVFPTSSHVGIYLGGNKMIVASSGHGRIMIQTVYSFYAGRRII